MGEGINNIEKAVEAIDENQAAYASTKIEAKN